MDITGEDAQRHLPHCRSAIRALPCTETATGGAICREPGLRPLRCRVMSQALPELEPMPRAWLPPASILSILQQSALVHFQHCLRSARPCMRSVCGMPQVKIVQLPETVSDATNALDKLIGRVFAPSAMNLCQGFAVCDQPLHVLEFDSKAVRVLVCQPS